MAFVGVNPRPLVAQLHCPVEQSERPEIEQGIDELALRGVELPPDLFERRFIDISDNNAAARTAKDVAERIDVHAFGPEKIRLTSISTLRLTIPKAFGFEATTPAITLKTG